MIIEKQYSIRKLNQKLDYKNQKYTITEIVSLHAVHFNIKSVHSVFYINQLYFAADDSLLSQPQFDNQSAPIYVENKEKWYIDKIVAEKLCHYNCDVMKWFQIKYTDYAVLEWNQAMNIKDTATLKWWMKHIREFQNTHSRLSDGFWHESHFRWTLWHCAVKQRGIVMG